MAPPMSQEFKTVFLINCGATVNVRDKCGLHGQDNVRIIIIDSHRPVRSSESGKCERGGGYHQPVADLTEEWGTNNPMQVWHGHKNDDDNTLVFLDKDDPTPSELIPDYEEFDDELKQGETLAAGRNPDGCWSAGPL